MSGGRILQLSYGGAEANAKSTQLANADRHDKTVGLLREMLTTLQRIEKHIEPSPVRGGTGGEFGIL